MFPDKSHFTVFDCFGGSLLEYFAKATSITAEPPEPEPKTIIEIIEDIWNNRDKDYNIRRLVKRLQRIDKQMSGDAREMFSQYIPNGDLKKYASELPGNLRKDFTGTMALLRNPDFQNLLVNYPRAPRVFIVAHETKDKVESEWAVRGADGKEYKPEDYLQAFERFVRENPAHIEAIGILLDRPRDWKTEALLELREKLKNAPLRFTEDILQKVHEKKYNKALVDIISMIKHAAKQDEELFTAEERVRRAVLKVTAGQKFVWPQVQWLNRIIVHLIANLSIDRSDFEELPVFTRAGGWGPANKAFEGKLEELIKKFNEEIAA
jgi:type I restriction enzyme R subunit